MSSLSLTMATHTVDARLRAIPGNGARSAPIPVAIMYRDFKTGAAVRMTVLATSRLSTGMSRLALVRNVVKSLANLHNMSVRQDCPASLRLLHLMASARRAKHLSLARVAGVAGTSANIGVNGCRSLAQVAYIAVEVELVAWVLA